MWKIFLWFSMFDWAVVVLLDNWSSTVMSSVGSPPCLLSPVSLPFDAGSQDVVQVWARLWPSALQSWHPCCPLLRKRPLTCSRGPTLARGPQQKSATLRSWWSSSVSSWPHSGTVRPRFDQGFMSAGTVQYDLVVDFLTSPLYHSFRWTLKYTLIFRLHQ